MVRGSLPALLLFAAASAPPSGAAQAPPPPEAVNAAITRGVDYLLRSQNRDGSWGVDLNERGQAQHDLRDGPCSLAVYALVKCGLPADHPALRRAVAFLLDGTPRHTYAVGMQIHALAALRDPAHEKRLEELLGILLELRRHDGWDYPAFDRGDLSNTQVAALGLRAAHAAGLDIPKAVWADLAEVALRHQEPAVEVPGEVSKSKRDVPRMAGFCYEPNGKPTGSMTTAGMTILGIAVEDPGRVDRRLAARIAEARELALRWLAHHFSVEGNPLGEAGWHYYYLYGLERVGAFFGIERIGAHDWYSEGAAQLLKEQRADGGWRNDGRTAWPPAPLPVANTCFALLFLRKATLSGETRLRETLHALEDAASPVRLRVDARETWTLWLTGFAPEIAADGLHVERVEWWIGGALVESVAGDPTKAWKNDRYAIRYQPTGGGELAVECRVIVRGPEGATREHRSLPLEVPTEHVLEPWMLEYARDAARNVLAGAGFEITASSEESAFQPKGDVLDGLQGSAWWAREDDPEPWIRLAAPKGVRLKEIWISPAAASEILREKCVSVERVELRLDGEDPLVVTLERDPRLKTKVVLPKPAVVRALELRVIDPPREPGKCVGFAEIEAR